MTRADGSAKTGPIPSRALPFLLRYVRMRPWLFGTVFTVIVGAASCAVGVQYAMKLLIDAMDAEDRQAALVWAPLALFIGLIAMENILWRLGGVIGSKAVIATGVDLRLDLFEHLTGHPMRYFNQHFSGALGNRVTTAAAATGGVFSTLIWNIMPPITDFLGAIIVLSTIRWPMALALIASVLLVGWLLIVFGIRGRQVHRAYAELASKASGELVDVVSNVWTVKAFSARARERQRLSGELGVEARAQRKSWMYIEKARLIHDACLVLMAGGMLVWAITLWRGGSITTGDVVIVSALTFRILHGSRDLALALVGTAQQFGVINETLQVIAQPHEVRDPEHNARLRPVLGAIRFENVTYTYPDGREVFEGFDLDIPAGQRVGLVGPSGAGKSTLISLIQRLDDVQGGRILIDGQPITEVTQDSLRARIAVVPQDIALFHRSVLENIRYGRPDATDEEVYGAARNAYCDEFIRELPQGYDTIVGERGVRLSGGQRQRLGIARAFLKDAPILILDEATSALDMQSERDIQMALSELMRGRTVVAIAHRLSTVSSFDRVLVLVDGRVYEDGPPGLLRKEGGLFKDLWRLQVEGFE
ncbi:MAG TPA: ABC transporter ATP-binding protein [Methylophilaceae bacterium]|nr:ABC transporter ATP-binding protein [Methylophilaceae bacterium]